MRYIDVVVVYVDSYVFFVGVLYCGIYCFRVFGVEVEDLINFDIVCGVVMFFGDFIEQCFIVSFIGMCIVVGEFFKNVLILFN